MGLPYCGCWDVLVYACFQSGAILRNHLVSEMVCVVEER